MDLQFSGLDCESMRDFSQYYRHRYFGIEGGSGKIFPARYITAPTPDSLHVLYYTAGAGFKEERIAFKALAKVGKFGLPVLGNVDAGPTSVYISAPPKRESIKGLSLQSLDIKLLPHKGFTKTMPDLWSAYCKQFPTWEQVFRGQRDGENPEYEFIYEIFNRKYRDFRSAVASLESGERLACAISHKTSLYLSGGSDKIQIAYRGVPVGALEINRDGKGYVNITPTSEYLRNLVNYDIGEASRRV